MARKFFSLVALLTVMVSPISTLVLFQTNSYSTIRFQTNGGSYIPAIWEIEGTYFETPQTTKEGHSFVNWYIDSSLTELFESNFIPKQDLTLYARWNINQYTITFQSNGGSTVNSITKDFGASITSPTTPTRQGHTFTGWFMDNELTNRYSFVTMPSNNLQLFAGWLSGSGSSQIPFELRNDSDVDMIRYYPYSYFTLENNIELPTNFRTISNFFGTIDGKDNNLTIRNISFINQIGSSAGINNLNVLIDLTTNQTINFSLGSVHVGFFANLNEGVLDNLEITYLNTYLTLKTETPFNDHYLGFIGKNNGILNHVELIQGNLNLNMITGNYIFGPLVGWNQLTLMNVSNLNVNVSAEESIDLGGVAGYSNGTMNNIINRANLVHQNPKFSTLIGGIASRISGISENLINHGNLTVLDGEVNLGGIAGVVDSETPLIMIDLINYGILRGFSDIFGDVIHIGGITSLLGQKITIKRSINLGQLINISSITKEKKNYSSTVGGLVAVNYGTILESYNVGNLTCEDEEYSELGGITGKNYGIIERSFNKGNLTSLNIESGTYVGGLVGNLANGTIKDVYNQGSISLESQSNQYISVAGGIVGRISESGDRVSIINGYASGQKLGESGNWFGGIIGLTNNPVYFIQNTHYFKTGSISNGIYRPSSDIGTTQYTNLNSMFFLASTLGNQWRNVSNEPPILVWENN